VFGAVQTQVTVPAPKTFTNQKSQEEGQRGAECSSTLLEVAEAQLGLGMRLRMRVIAWPCFPVMQLPGPYTVCNSYGSNKKQTWYSSGDRDVGKAAIQLAFIEWLGFERSSKLTHPQPPAVGRAATHQLRLPWAPSKLALSASRDGASLMCSHVFIYSPYWMRFI